VPRRGYQLVIDACAAPARSRARHGAWWIAACAALTGTLIAARATHPPALSGDSPAAAFDTGYYYWSTAKSIVDVQRSMPYFERAVRDAPSNGLGYAGLAYADMSLALRYGDADRAIAAMHAALSNATTAVRLSGDLAPAHAAAGQYEALFGNPQKGEREFRTALRLDPTLVEAHTWYAELLMSEARIPQAIAQLRDGIAYDSTWTEATDDLALLQYLRRQYSDALAFASQSLTLEPRDVTAQYLAALANATLSRRALAERELVPMAHSRDTLAAIKASTLLALLFAQDGNASASRRAFVDARASIARAGQLANPSAILSIAAMLALQHEPDKAFAWLARMDRDSRRLFANDVRLDALRTDARYRGWVAGS